MHKHEQRMAKSDKEMVASLNCEGIEFHVSKKCYHNIETNKNISINVFIFEKKNRVYEIHLSKQNFENHIELLLANIRGKSH